MASRPAGSSGLKAFMIAALCLFTLFCVLLTTERRVCVTIRSDPQGATVFDNTDKIGVTPLRIELVRGELRLLRLVRRDCLDAKVAVEAETFLPKGAAGRLRRLMTTSDHEVLVRMTSAASASLIVTSDPAGAEVFLNGRREGMTPFSRDELPPGTHTVRLSHPECFARTETLLLEPGAEKRRHYVMESKVAALYRDLIEKDPMVLTHYAELGHYHVLRGQFAEAAQALRDGLQTLAHPGAKEQSRFCEELRRIYVRQFVYPDETTDNKIRPVCRELVQKALDEGLWNDKHLQRHLKSMDAYDKRHPPD